MDNSDLINRLKAYYSNPSNSEICKYIKGISASDKSIILQNETSSIHVTIDDLENNRFDLNTFSVKQTEPIKTEEEEIEVMEEITPTVTPTKPNIDSLNNKATLNDIKTLVELDNKETLDTILKTFALNEQTGNVDINKAISVVTENSVSEAANSLMENKNFSTELYKYDVTGKLIVPEDVSNTPVSKESIIDNSFKNVLIYTEVAKKYGINYTQEQMLKAKEFYIVKINDKLNTLGYNNPTNMEMKQPEPAKQLQKTYKPEVAKAGFADVFILTVIVLVYAVIIVNLIMKLK